MMNRKKKLPIFWKLIRVIAIAILGLLILEISGRLYAMIKLGVDYAAYGTKLNTSKLEEAEQHLSVIANLTNYSKYKPYSKKKDTDAKNRIFDFTINNLGFRGPAINREKTDSVFRIVCLGASSTFGYGNHDYETYPYYLDSLLNENINELNCPQIKHIEVINLGIPFQTSDRIYSLFTIEGLPLKPDMVTFYEGYNDASLDIFGRQAKDHGSISTRYHKLLYALGRRIIFVKLYQEWLLINGFTYDKAEFDAFNAGRSTFFINNLSKIHTKCNELGIIFIVITQQSQSCTLSDNQLKTISYQLEAENIRSELQIGKIKYREACFLAHKEITDNMRTWALKKNIPLINGIQALDTIRGEMKNFVHLKPRANLILSKAIAGDIIKLGACN